MGVVDISAASAYAAKDTNAQMGGGEDGGKGRGVACAAAPALL
jgi:hypothetical protein